MKKAVSFLLVSMLGLSLCACAADPGTATKADIAKLDGLYAGREVRYGEMHAHADTGGNSDGKLTLNQWKEKMAEFKMDFFTVADHRQLTHMRLEDWDNAVFIGGSEAGGQLAVSPGREGTVHYNMMFADADKFEALLTSYPTEFRYVGGYFAYPKLTVDFLHQLSRDTYNAGGLFVHVHPNQKGYLESDEPLDYFFGDVMGLEVFVGYEHSDMSSEENRKSYKLWTDLLALGKRVFATCGSDAHSQPADVPISLGTIYSEEKDAMRYMDYIRSGDFTAGPAGIRMIVGDTRMGGQCSFEGNRLVLSAGQIHSLTFQTEHTYRVDLYDDKGLVFSEEISGVEPAYFAIDADSEAKYYHANIYDVTADRIVAVGNPIWNS